ncbi:MAG: DUF6898 family protein [Magnetospiraceae bacterium]
MVDRVQVREVIFEIMQIGNMLRVAAVDPITGTEVTVAGPLSAGEGHLKRVAQRKLEYVLTRQLSEGIK